MHFVFKFYLQNFSICMLCTFMFFTSCNPISVFSGFSECIMSSESEEILNNITDFMDYCQTNDLRITVIGSDNYAENSLSFAFGPERPIDKLLIQKCFSYFKFILCGPNRYAAHAMVPWKDKGGSYAFKNLSSGSYLFSINPCYYLSNCTSIYYNSLHTFLDATSSQFSSSSLLANLNVVDGADTAILPLGIILLIILIVGAGFFYKRHALAVSRHRFFENIPVAEKSAFPENGIQNLETQDKNIDVYILYPHDSVTKEKVLLLKDFLLRYCHFNVILLDDELSEMLIDPTGCITRIITYKCSNVGDNCSSSKKIIIVEPKTVSREDRNEQLVAIQDEIEENAFHEAIAVLRFDWARVLRDYCHLFVIHFNGCSYTQDLKSIVPRVRYNIPENLIDLCFNLSMHKELHYYEFQKYLREKLESHPVKDICTLKAS